MTPEQTAWLAGLFEGEGCLRARHGGWELSINMTDEDVVRRVHEVSGVGRVYEVPSQRPGWQPQYRWYVSKRADVTTVVAAIRPHLGSRRGSRADEFLSGAQYVPSADERAAAARRARDYRARRRVS